MREFQLKRPEKKLLRKSSRQKVEDYFVSFPEPARSEKWLYQNNRYRTRCTSRYEGDLVATPSAVVSSQVIHYVSASAPAHAIDGWSYFGRAVDATLRGDTYSAVHFAYYAELRGAMSLLASEGIGVFRDWHATIDATGAFEPFPPNAKPNPKKRPRAPTHKVIWPMLRYWSTLPSAVNLLDELVSPHSIRLSDWLAAARAIGRTGAVAQQWLSAWGLDLKVMADDHDNRNLASYRPSEFRRAPRLDVNEIAQFVEELWRMFEPGRTRRFPSVERLLLRSALRKGRLPPPSMRNLEQQLGLSSSEAAEWSAFLSSTDDPLPLELAEKESAIEDSRCHLQILSRAALLLFVATSAARRLLTNSAYTAEGLAFWWERFGEDRGLWSIGAAPGDPLDFWADILRSLEDSDSWRLENPVGTSSLRHWRRRPGTALDDLGAFELVGIWGLMP